jgi:hypothetical protein
MKEEEEEEEGKVGLSYSSPFFPFNLSGPNFFSPLVKICPNFPNEHGVNFFWHCPILGSGFTTSKQAL